VGTLIREEERLDEAKVTNLKKAIHGR